jgi:outer membrane protein assembly factor BamD (BamD/ComL family)
VKWFLIGSLCLLCSVSLARGDAAGDLFNQGAQALAAEQYDVAAKDFDSIITGYPLSPNIDEVRIRAGFAYLHAGKFPEAIDRLAKEAAPNAKPQFRGTALYFTALAEFSQAQKNADKAQAGSQFATTVTTLTTLLGLPPSPDNNGYFEQALYYRALAYFLKPDDAAAEKDLLTIIQQYPASLSRPDYYLRLGSLYAIETNAAVTAKKSAAEVNAAAQKALDAFDAVSRDPNALVQANEANMNKAEILFLVAQLDAASPAGYQKALDAFRLVKRKDDMIPLQQQRLDDLRKAAQSQAQANAAGGLHSLASDSSLLIGREAGRLKDLQEGPDPVIQALIRMAECYVMLKEPDEARTILHRVAAHAKLTPDQQQEVDFQVLYSYVLGGQIDQANKALDDYLAKHAGDPQADTLSYQIAAKLLERKDYTGALAQADRSLKDFPQGKVAADAVALKAQALNRLNRIPEADAVVNNFLAANPTSPVANQMFLTKAQGEGSRGEFDNALKDYAKVKDNTSASPDLRAAADAGYIQTLNSLKKYDDLIAEAKKFQTQYATSKALPTVLLFQGMAMDQKHDPAAVAALQAVAAKYPKDDASPFALFYVVNIYQRSNPLNVPALIKAYTDFQTAFPQSYALLVQAADTVSTVLITQKKFDDAIALYQPLTDAKDPAVAAAARNKIGSVWFAAAKSLGYYQSMGLPARAEAEKRLAAGEQMYLQTLKNSSDQVDAVGEAIDGLLADLKQRRSWGLLKDADLEGYLTKLGADITDADVQARLELAKAGLVFMTKEGAKQYPAALDRFRKVIAANPNLRLTRQETDQYGELLLAAKDYPTALKIYNDLLANAAPNDNIVPADANYGLGATYLAQGDIAQARNYFLKMRGALWHPHIADANYGIALADEQSGQAADLADARQTYAGLMQNPQAGAALQAKAMLGYGRILEKSGATTKPLPQGLPTDFAVHYYLQPNLLFNLATPEQSAEGLYDAGQVYANAGDKVSAKAQYDLLIKTYGATAPDWVAKAQSAN